MKDIFEGLLRLLDRGNEPAYRDEDYILFLESMDARASMQSGLLLERLRSDYGVQKDYRQKCAVARAERLGYTSGGKL